MFADDDESLRELSEIASVLSRMSSRMDLDDLTLDLLEKIPHVAIQWFDQNGRVLFWNRASESFYGYSRIHAIGQTLDKLIYTQDQQAHFMSQLLRAASGLVVGPERKDVFHRDGSARTVLTSLYAMQFRDGETFFAGVDVDISREQRVSAALQRMANFDALTSLPNRALLGDRLKQAMAHARRQGKKLAVAFIDLDGFKPINDALGREVGDKLLLEVSQRLVNILREGDTVSRLGGDEFVLLICNLESTEECKTILDRVLVSLASPMVIDGTELQVSASIGFTIAPDDPSEADGLIRHADQAMYQAKLSGRNRHHFFDPAHDLRTKAGMEICSRVLNGLDYGEFELHFQPRVDMRRAQVLGAEALLRWNHPRQGLMMPGAFLPDIENSGETMIVLGRWVLETAVLHLDKWLRSGLSLSISVNIAAAHLLAPNFVEHLKQLLDKFPGVPAHLLELEILESAALEDMDAVASVISQCRGLGVHFALDDFGTGYSSLVYLRRLQVDILKIDRSFVIGMLEDADDQTIVEAVIGLARAFGREVIAEGVESIQHGQALINLGCDQAQGYGIARPMPASQLASWIGAYQPWSV